MAYGTNKPFGLRPESSINGGSWTEKLGAYAIYSNRITGSTRSGDATSDALLTPLFRGDPVSFGIIGDGDNESVEPVVVRTHLGETDTPSQIRPILGVFHSCEYTLPDGRFITDNKWTMPSEVQPGSPIIAYVYDDPMTIFEIQVSTSTRRIADAIFSGDYIDDDATFPGLPGRGADRKPAPNDAFFGQNYYFGLGFAPMNDGTAVTDWAPTSAIADNAFYPNTPVNPMEGDTLSGASAVYLDVGIRNRGLGRNFVAINRAPFAADATGITEASFRDAINTLASEADSLRDEIRADFLDTAIPLKALGFSKHPDNTIFDENGFVRPFLNVRVVINNHVAKGGSYGI